MTYLRQPRKSRRVRVFFFSVCATILLLAIFHPPMPTFISAFMQKIGTPLWSGSANVGATIGGFSAFFTSRMTLEEENRTLYKEMELLRLRSVSYAILREENEALRRILGQENNASRTLASVLIGSDNAPYNILIIDRGSADGVSKDDIVFVEYSALGWISDVYANTATVTLFSSPGIETTVRIPDAGVSATATGRGGGNFVVKLPRGVEVKEGARVELLGTPPSVLGTVAEVIMKPADSFQTVLFRLPVNLTDLGWVEVGKMRAATSSEPSSRQ